MVQASREFQIFAKPIGAACNLNCAYCYYLQREQLYSSDVPLRMSDEVLEAYIVQHIEASPGETVNFSWHGGEPTLLGLEYFRKIVSLQKNHLPPGRSIINGIQTNGTLIDEAWCLFLSQERFFVGLSMDGPDELHDRYRVGRNGRPSARPARRGYRLLRKYGIPCHILCVVHALNVGHPLRIYRFFKELRAANIVFLPLVEPLPGESGGVSERTVPAEAWGDFLCTVFDEWLARDIGRVNVEIFDEAAGTAMGREQALCIFRKTCGDVPVIERNGDFYSCDHFVAPAHRLGNIQEDNLGELIESDRQRAFGRAKWELLPRSCRSCEVLSLCHGGCPKDRILQAPDGPGGLNYLCAGYRRFFNHCRPFLAELSALRNGPAESRDTPPERDMAIGKRGRNDPCPCGSGKKYKKCCLNRPAGDVREKQP